jgi:osmotically inducible protein OsmC
MPLTNRLAGRDDRPRRFLPPEVALGGNPEQLLADAHSGCFTMALSNGLSAAGHQPESLCTKARVQLRDLDDPITLARIDLETDGNVPGIDERQFQAYAEAATRDFPVSRALAGIPEMILTSKLLTADSTAVPVRSD